MKISIKKLFSRKKVLVIISMTGMICLAQLSFSGFVQSPSATATASNNFWLWQFFGRLHPLAVHFPVGLLLFAAILELVTIRKFLSPLRPAINLLVITGVIASIFSAVFGLLLSREGDYGKDLLGLHQWLSIATVLLGLLTWFLLNRILARSEAKIPIRQKTISKIKFTSITQAEI